MNIHYVRPGGFHYLPAVNGECMSVTGQILIISGMVRKYERVLFIVNTMAA